MGRPAKCVFGDPELLTARRCS